jgi:proline iminopeptidase
MIFYSQQLCDRYLAGAPDLGFNVDTGNAVSQAIAKLDLTPQMKQFQFPTLVIEGRFDLNVTPDVAWTVAHMVPGAQLAWFEKSGHLPYYEEPDKYVSVVSTFLAAHDAAATR